jgi:hypothetical protein
MLIDHLSGSTHLLQLLKAKILVSETTSPKPKKLLDQLRDTIRIKHYSYSTEKTYVHWVKRYILFHNKRHPAEMGVPEIEAFLSNLAQEGNVSASTQNQAFNAILFLYRNVLKIELFSRHW